MRDGGGPELTCCQTGPKMADIKECSPTLWLGFGFGIPTVETNSHEKAYFRSTFLGWPHDRESQTKNAGATVNSASSLKHGRLALAPQTSQRNKTGHIVGTIPRGVRFVERRVIAR